MHAALVNGSILNFTAALGGRNATGTAQPLAETGSWWALPDSNLYLGIESFNGLIFGISQSASGSHSGAPDGSESPAIDKAWLPFYMPVKKQPGSERCIFNTDMSISMWYI